MELESLLGLIGLARRAGKLAVGEALTAELVTAGRARAIFLAQDAGEATRRKVMRHDARVPVFVLPCGKETLGRAVGFSDCAVCAMSDIGMAQAAAKKLAETGGRNAGKASHPAGKRCGYSASTLAEPTRSAGEPTLTVTFPGVLVRTMATARPSKAWQRAEVY